jgi:integrase
LRENGLIGQTRDVEEPIDFILKDPHPLRHLYRLADLMEESLPPESAAKYQRAMNYRDMFLVRFLTANPLRIKHFSEMTWRADGTGNLYRREDGTWWLRFPKSAFKNRKRLKKERHVRRYEAMLPPSLRPYVETYLSKYRPLLLGADSCDYVFRPGPRGGPHRHKTGGDKPVRPDSLAKTLHRYARSLLHCMGFGPHAYRHIIATDYLKNDPHGLMTAARILHDSPEAILKYYGHVQHGDYFRHWIDYHEAQLVTYRAGSTEVAGR